MGITMTYVGLDAARYNDPVAGNTITLEFDAEVLYRTAAVLPRGQFYKGRCYIRSYQAVFTRSNGFVPYGNQKQYIVQNFS